MNAYEIVKESQKLGLKSVKPNVNCKDVDECLSKIYSMIKIMVKIFYSFNRSWNWIRSS